MRVQHFLTFSTIHLYLPRMLIHLQLRLSFHDEAACKRLIVFDLKLEFFHRSKHSASYCSLALLECLDKQGGIVDLGWLFTSIGQYHVQAFYIQKLKSYTLRVHVYSESCKPVSSSLKPQVPPPHWRNLSMVLKSNCATGRLTRHCSHTMCRWEQTICRYR